MSLRDLIFKMRMEDGVSSALENVSGKFDTLGSQMTKTGKSLSTKVTLPLVTAGGVGIKMAANIETGLNKVSTLADESVVPMDKMKKEIRSISDEAGIAQGEIQEAVYDSLSAGVDTADVLEFVRSNIELTRAGFTDMDTAIDASTTVLNAYGDDMYKISDIHDIFVQTQDKGKISVDELGSSIGRVVPSASSLGVGLHDLGASYAIMTAKGQNANIATTNLKGMIDELGKSGSDTDEILKNKTGKSFHELMDSGESLGDVLGTLKEHADDSGLSLQDLFGSSTAGSAAVTLLSDGVEGYNKSLEDMNNSIGKTAENNETMQDSNLEFEQSIVRVKNAFTDVGEILLPIGTEIANVVSDIAERIAGMDEETMETIVTIAGVVAAIGPVLMVGGVLFTGISKVVGVISTVYNVLSAVAFVLGGTVTAAIGVVIAIGIVLYRNWDTIREKGMELGEKISGAWDTLKTATSDAWDKISEKITGVLETISGAWEKTKEFFSAPIKGVVNIAQNVKERFTGGGTDGSNRAGLDNVPFDGYVSELHKGEIILPKSIADDYRSRGGSRHNLPKSVPNQGNSNQTALNPTINININGNADSNTVNEIEEAVERVLAKQIRKASLQS